MQYSGKLQAIISQVTEIAGYLRERGWAERNGGNISCNITEASMIRSVDFPPSTTRSYYPKR